MEWLSTELTMTSHGSVSTTPSILRIATPSSMKGKWQCVPAIRISPSSRDAAMRPAAPNFPFIDEGVACDEGARRGSRRVPQPRTSPSSWDAATRPAAPNFPFIDEGVAREDARPPCVVGLSAFCVNTPSIALEFSPLKTISFFTTMDTMVFTIDTKDTRGHRVHCAFHCVYCG